MASSFHLTMKFESPNIFLVILILLCLHFQKNVALNSMAILKSKSTQNNTEHQRAGKVLKRKQTECDVSLSLV